MRSGMKKRTSKSSKRKLRAVKREPLYHYIGSCALPIHESTVNDLRRRTRLSDECAGGKISLR
jgi:hypothetical protein